MDTILKDNNGRTVASKSRITSFSKKALFFLTLLLWIDRILLTYIRAFAMGLPLIGGYIDYIIILVYAFLVVFAAPEIFSHLHASDFIFLFATVIVCLVHYLAFPDTVEVANEFLPSFLFLVFPLYFVGLSLDFDKVYPWLYRLSLITIVAFTIYKLFVAEPMDDIQSMYEGDMWSSYNLLPHVCVVALAALKKPRIINIALSVIGVLMIASLGSRGPLLCSALAMAVYLLFFKKYKRPVLAYSMIIIVTTAIIMGMDAIMEFLYDLSKDAGLSIRVFDKYFEGTLSYTSDRDAIASQLYDRIAENPAIGYGLFSDRVAAGGSYAHHIAIELWHAFGVVVGTAILAAIIIVLLRAARLVKKVEKYALLFLPLLFAGFIKLFMSGSILNEVYFFLLLGFSVNLMRGYKRH